MNKNANRTAKNALINILAFPGLGSLRSGRRAAGAGQVILLVAGCIMLLVWFSILMSEFYALEYNQVQPRKIGWIGATGGILIVISWLWACVTSLSLFREAAKPAAAPPPVLPSRKPGPEETKIQTALAELPQWRRDGEIITRTFEFKDFVAVIKFVNAIAEVAEATQHHPDVDIRWNKVTLALTTHDAGGLTEKDFALAGRCDALAANAA
jgi:4a-hydroxytetrahydrobiopterin dehydratase